MARNRLAHDEPYLGPLGYLHFNGKLLHRLVWSDVNGPIPAGFIIHHINGDKLDNRLENLEMLSVAEHAAHHHRGRKQTATHVARRRASMDWHYVAGGAMAGVPREEIVARGRKGADARWGRRDSDNATLCV